MQAKWKRRLGLVGLAAVVGWLSGGCAQERDPINRVQASALDKHFFVGPDLASTADDPEFYMRNTVIDVPLGAEQEGLFTASFAQPLSRVKWEISETQLIARQTYERITNSDFHGARTTNNGQVVGMWTVTSHFDIRREYNAQTGQENNVVVENTTDRPWYEREFMRVDWSTNLVTDGYEVDTLSQMGIYGGVKWDPAAYYVSDTASPNAPVFSAEDGYFDITAKAFATPKIVSTPFGDFPACFLPGDYGGSAPLANCNATEVTLRLSFKTVKGTDYEPSDQTGVKQDAFGWFTVDRYGYDRNYGILDENWHRFAAKYNVWQQSHVPGAQCAVDFWRDDKGNVGKFKVDASGAFFVDKTTGLPIPDANGQPYPGTPVGADVHRDLNKNNTEDDCEFTDASGALLNPGSRCDEFTNKCDIPLYNRTSRTIPWYYGQDAPPDLFPATASALAQWNLAVKRALMIGKGVEAKRVGLDPAPFTTATGAGGNALDLTTEDGLVADAGKSVKDIFVLCHNPVIDGDASVCGKTGLLARVGDIRYNSVNIIQNPQLGSPWGIMVDANDPLTGEKVATSVNIWGEVSDFVAQQTEDLIRWLNGEISDQQIASGAYLRDWANANKLGVTPHAAATLDKNEIKTRLGSVDLGLAKSVALSPSQQQLPHALRLKAAAAALGASLGPSMDSTLEATRQSLVGSPWEAQLATPEWLQAAGMDPATPVAGNDPALAAASMLRGMNPMLKSWARHQRDITMAKNASCLVEQPEPDALVGIARIAQKLYPLPDANDPSYPAKLRSRDEALHRWIRESLHVGVIAHEMGHSMGLRHNFTGSFDALNFHTEYWQLRTRNGKEHFCEDPANPGTLDATTQHTNGEDCVGPRWVDPVTEAETNGLVWKFGQTTVMDYPGDRVGDTSGIGPYDKAAMRFGYADVVDVDTDAVVPRTGVDFQGLADKGSAYVFQLDGFGGIVGQQVGNNHYSTYADKYGVLGTCTAQTDAKDPLSAKCSGPPLDYVARRDMISVGKYGDDAVAHLPGTLASFAIDSKRRARHPYMFGSDEFADIGNIPVFRFDEGADSYEQFQFVISTYENRYIFNNFRRDNPAFNSRAVVRNTMSRYFDKVQQMTKSLALIVGLEGSQATAALANPGQLMPLALGASDGLKMFARVLTRPEPGPYALATPALSPTPKAMLFAQAESNNFIVLPAGTFNISLGSGEGRFLHNDYDYNQGYYWSSYQTQVGSAYEKDLAVWYLSEAYNQFISNSKEDYIDGRYKNLNYASLYPNQVRRLFSQLLQNDPMTYAPYVSSTRGTGIQADGRATVQYLPWEKWDPTQPATMTLDYPSDAIAVDPLHGWEQQYRMLINLFYFGPTTLTMDLVDQLRIFSPGGSDTISIPPSQQATFRDPSTGIEYIARSYGTEQINTRLAPVSRSMGARMIQYANALAKQTYVVTAEDATTGELTYAADSTGQAVCKYATDPINEFLCFQNGATLKNYSANLDVVRQLTRSFGYGPLGHGER